MENVKRIGWFLVAGFFFWSCKTKKIDGPPLFEALRPERTGIQFQNKLSYDPAFNLFKYMYFYNGSGVGAGDFNNDGRVDLFFGSNQGQNTLYLNEGNLRFRDVTKQAGIPADGGWTTGISVVDINNDGLLDVYVCRVGQYETLRSRNQLLINQGLGKDSLPHFADKAADYGLAFSGFSTQAAFFDYDNDGDLDVFLLNHSVHQSNNFRPRAEFKGTYDSLSGDRIYRNDVATIGRFVDVTKETGINSTSISYGLGVSVADIDLDGYPDLYVGNDFHENDYLYINQKNGTFKEDAEERLMHTSQYSMGVDVADVNNDALPEIISVDMLSADPYILKRSLGESTYDVFNLKLSFGYSHQYTRNNLQFNRGNGLFSETGLYSGVAATDWSWAPLWMDFDNDGYKDLFISNGIPKRMNDIDYVNFVGTPDVQQKINSNDMDGKDLSLIDKFPEIRLPNKFYRNRGNLSFDDEGSRIAGDEPTFSNGAVYADLDNDGDLEIVVNNVDAPALVYENKCADTKKNSATQVKLIGPANNRNATGAKLVVYSKGETKTVEQFPVRGFLSSMDVPLHLGLNGAQPDSAFLIWPDGTYTPLQLRPGFQTVAYKKGLPLFDFSRFQKRVAKVTVEDITAQAGLDYIHRENRFVEFDREPLMPHSVSTESPCLAVADANGDGLEDVFFGGSRNTKATIFFQQPGGRFSAASQAALDADSSYENTDACWADVDKDGALDLIVASGGNEFYGKDEHNTPRVYRNDGRGILQKLPAPFGPLYLTASCVVADDVNGDGYTDLFVGGRAVPWAYGEVPQSYLLLNNRNGTFRDATDEYAKDLRRVGFVTRALWHDVDRDGDNDLLLSLEWGGLVAYLKNEASFSKKELTTKKGWWNFLLPFDADGDGDVDLVAGNLGLNSRLQASKQMPVRLYYNDFDGNGKKEQVLTHYVGEKQIPFASKAELEKQMPVLKKKFLYAEDFAKASLGDILGEDKLENAALLTADYFANALLLNDGHLNFTVQPLPWQAQVSSLRDATVLDANGDGRPDLFLAGNFYDSNTEMGRYDADFGTLLLNGGGGRFAVGVVGGQPVKGQVRRMQPMKLGPDTILVLAKNNDSARVVRFR